jgi:hypothetical protein
MQWRNGIQGGSDGFNPLIVTRSTDPRESSWLPARQHTITPQFSPVSNRKVKETADPKTVPMARRLAGPRSDCRPNGALFLAPLVHRSRAPLAVFPRMNTADFPRIDADCIRDILAFVHHHGLSSAHYWGFADKGLTLALHAIPGFKVGLTDYHDRWHRGAHFFNDDDDEPPRKLGPEYAVPAWLEGIPCFFEGFLETNFIIDDQAPTEDHAYFSQEEFLTNPAITHMVVVRKNPRLSRAAIDFRWVTNRGVHFGVRLGQLWRDRGTAKGKVLPHRRPDIPRRADIPAMNSATSNTSGEALVHASRTAQALADDLQVLHRLACNDDPMLALLVSDLIDAVEKARVRLREIEELRRP